MQTRVPSVTAATGAVQRWALDNSRNVDNQGIETGIELAHDFLLRCRSLGDFPQHKKYDMICLGRLQLPFR